MKAAITMERFIAVLHEQADLPFLPGDTPFRAGWIKCARFLIQTYGRVRQMPAARWAERDASWFGGAAIRYRARWHAVSRESQSPVCGQPIVLNLDHAVSRDRVPRGRECRKCVAILRGSRVR